MIDIVFPKENESEFIAMAEKLGLEGLLFVYDKKKNMIDLQTKTKVKLFSTTTRQVIKNRGDARSLFEKAKDSIIFDLEDQEKDFSKVRNSGLNEVLLELARKNNLAVGFSVSSIINSKRRSITLGRMMQNAMLCRKKKTQVIIASFTNNPWKMRARAEIESLAKELGLEKDSFLDVAKIDDLFHDGGDLK